MHVSLSPILACCCLLAVLAAPVYGADTAKGAKIYRRHCSLCHGQDGSPVMPNAADLSQSRGIIRSDLVLKERIANGKRGCPAYRGIIPQRDILDLIAHIRTLY